MICTCDMYYITCESSFKLLTKFQIATLYTFRDMNLILVWIFATDGQTQSDAYEPTVQVAQVGSKNVMQN